jgi:anti-sigma regulatory factor (Ser/Thr protein kinase)
MPTEPGCEVRSVTPREFIRQAPADARHLVELRRTLQRWVADLGLSFELQQDVVLASYEAMANSAEHAYRQSAPGAIDVHAIHAGDKLTVTVTDQGTWKRPDGSDTFRGRGLKMIQALAHTSALRRGSGTRVTMTWALER